MTSDECPKTERVVPHCECAILRHQLRLADELAKATLPIVDELRKMFPEHPLVRLLDIYSEARIHAEVTAASDIEEEVERRR
jgi:hypothetical protein